MTDLPSHEPVVHRRAAIAACLRTLAVAAMIICGLAAGPSDALGQSLDAARAAGMIGEQADGYAVARGNVTPAVRQLVSKVNSERAAIYARRAREQKVPAAAVGQTYAAQIAAKAPKGTWIQSRSGAWSRK
jgi:hypothetical protein